MHGAVVGSRPGLGDADPAAAVLVHGSIPIPVELHFDAAVFVGVDLLACRSGDDCRLRAGGVGLGGDALAAVRGGFRHYVKANTIGGGAIGPGTFAAA